jgi:hypothetical protein
MLNPVRRLNPLFWFNYFSPVPFLSHFCRLGDCRMTSLKQTSEETSYQVHGFNTLQRVLEAIQVDRCLEIQGRRRESPTLLWAGEAVQLEHAGSSKKRYFLQKSLKQTEK